MMMLLWLMSSSSVMVCVCVSGGSFLCSIFIFFQIRGLDGESKQENYHVFCAVREYSRPRVVTVAPRPTPPPPSSSITITITTHPSTIMSLTPRHHQRSAAPLSAAPACARCSIRRTRARQRGTRLAEGRSSAAAEAEGQRGAG
jgi:hypothetical protein